MIPLNDLKRSVEDEESETLRNLVADVAVSGSYILGNQVDEFEKEFSAYLGVEYVTSVSSGTDALVIALRSLGVQIGSKVLITPNAGGYTTTALLEIGAVPIFVDCDLTGRMDLESLAHKLTLNSDANCVVATHLYGLNSNIEEVSALCKSFGIKLVEDCAQSTGAVVDGKKLGSWGDVATFSFYPTKNLGAIGDAGAIATSSETYSSVQRELRQYGWSSRYKVATPFGKNSRTDEVQAAVLRHRLPQLDGWNARRMAIWNAYEEALRDSVWTIIGENATSFVAHLGVIVAPEGLRDKAMEMLESRGVGTAIHYPILDYLQEGWSGLLDGDCPNARHLTSRIFTIPLFPGLSDEEVKAVAASLRQVSLELSRGL